MAASLGIYNGGHIMADIYFRTDGNIEIATGHIMRCLTIARACTRKGADVKFIVSDGQSLALIKERFIVPQEFDVYCLNSDYTALPDELPALSALITRAKTAAGAPKPWMFIDSYYATTSYLLSLRDQFRVAYLDDLRSFDCPVDLIINYDTDKDCVHYSSAGRRLLGVQYTPLRRQFAGTAYTVRPAVGHVLLSTGGTDPYAAAEHLLHAIYHESPDTGPAQGTQLLQSLHYHILTSSANMRYDALASYARKHPNVHIHENILDVASLMSSCDLAVSAGGTTLCELCAVGVPTISYLMADNQRTAVETYAGLGLIPYAGDIRSADNAVISSILSFMAYMSQNLSARAKSSQSMRAFLNGTGADQIACELTS